MSYVIWLKLGTRGCRKYEARDAREQESTYDTRHAKHETPEARDHVGYEEREVREHVESETREAREPVRNESREA